MFAAFSKTKLMLGGLTLGITFSGPQRQELLHSATSPVFSAPSADSVQTLTFEWAAVSLAMQPPYDTVQLQAIPRTAKGAVVHNITVHYATTDTRLISVSGAGFVTALMPTNALGGDYAHVVASVTQGGRTVTDTAIILVTQNPLPSPLATLSIHPQPGGLTAAHGNLHKTQYSFPSPDYMPFFATIATGNPQTDTICNDSGCQRSIVVHFTSSDSTIAYIDQKGWFHPLRPGRVTFTVSTIAYGVRKVDSLPFSIGYHQRSEATLYISNGPQHSALAVRRGLWAPPYSVGLHLFISNETHEPVEVSLPVHKAHFEGVNDWLEGNNRQVRTASVDTLADSKAGMLVVVDSVGTHVLQYRGLKTGVALSDTITVLPYP